jgi:ParB family chromosome partitioning protein
MNDRKPERRGLGRGLSALMADISLEPEGRASGTPRADQVLPIEKLQPNPLQPRRDFEPDALESLAASLRQKGIIQPLVVRPVAGSDHYEIVAGERRWRAAQMAQLHEIPVVIRDLSDVEVLEVAIIENIQRSDLNAIEEAMGYKQLIDRFGHTQEKLAEALSKSRSHVANLLRLLTLPEDVQLLVRSGKLSAGHARALITSPRASEIAQNIVAKGLSVRETERLIRESVAPKSLKGSGNTQAKDADTLAIEGDLSANLQMRVQILHEAGSNRGTLTIRYETLEDLDFLCQALSVARRDQGF